MSVPRSLDSQIDCISRKNMKLTDFLHAGTIFGMSMVRNGCGQSDDGTFFHAATNSGKLKVDSIIFGVVVVKNGHGFLVHETLESVVLRMNL